MGSDSEGRHSVNSYWMGNDKVENDRVGIDTVGTDGVGSDKVGTDWVENKMMGGNDW